MTLLVALWPLLMLAGLGLLGRGGSRWHRYLALLALVPPVALFVIGLQNRFVFEVRYFLISVPLVLILLAGYASGVRTVAGRTVAFALLLVPVTVGLVNQQTSEMNPRVYDFDAIVERIADEAGPGDLLVYEPWYLEDTVDYYAPDLDAVALRDLDALPGPDESPTVFVIGSFLDQQRHATPHDQAVGALDEQRDLMWHTQTPTLEARAFR
jgi:hypothetical protein